MTARSWREKLGKYGTFRQSLFHHVLAQLGFVAALAEPLRSPEGLGLSDDQLDILLASVLCHDAGKADPAWQDAAQRGAKPPPHAHHPDAERAIQHWLASCGRDGDPAVIAAVRAAVGLHHRATQGAASVLAQQLHGGQKDVRWRELARLVEGCDKTCSASNVKDAVAAARKHIDARITFTLHRVQLLRGVTTVFVHEACERTFRQHGWRPALNFADGTLYAALATSDHAEPTVDAIRDRLTGRLEDLLDPAKLSEQVVGNPTGDMLPKPELFQLDQFGAYLRAASKRSKGANLRKKLRSEKDGKFTPLFLGTSDTEGKLQAYWRHRHRGIVPPVPVAERDQMAVLDRLVDAVPLDGILRFFKAAFLGGKLVRLDGKRRAEWLTRFEKQYEVEFGRESFAGLKGVANDPPKHLAMAIDPFLEQAVPHEGVKWSSKPSAAQVDELIRRLIAVVERSQLPVDALPAAMGARALAELLLADLSAPGAVRTLDAEAHLQSYCRTKELTHGGAICPISNEPSEGVPGSGDDLGLSTDGHTNRLPMQGKTWKDRGGVAASRSTRGELMLRRLILGQPPAKLLVLIPPVSVGSTAGRKLVDEVASLEQEIALHSSGRTPAPTRRFSLALTGSIARQRHRLGLAAPLGNVLAYSRDPNKSRSDGTRLASELLQAFGPDDDSPALAQFNEDNGTTFETWAEAAKSDAFSAKAAAHQREFALASLNEECGTQFPAWDRLVEEIYAAISEEAKRALDASEEVRARRKRAFQLGDPPVHFVCQTPNLILALLPRDLRLSKEESAANAAIRELFLSLVIADGLGVSVAIIEPDEALTFTGGEGSVRLPRNAAVRSEVARARAARAAAGNSADAHPAAEWLLPHEVAPWLRALDAVHQVSEIRDDKRNSVFPGNSALYHVLSARSAGALMRRAEAKTKRRSSMAMVRAFETLAPFLG